MYICTCDSGSSVIEAKIGSIINKNDLFCSQCGLLKPRNIRFFKNNGEIMNTFKMFHKEPNATSYICSSCLVLKKNYNDTFICNTCKNF